MASPSETQDRLAASLEDAVQAPKKRALVIVNPYAATVSDRLRNLVLYALAARYEVDARDTQARGHATEICREAAHEGYDVVLAFGGDGTVNECLNGLVGSDTPLTCLPGGTTNVYCRLLGIPGEIVDATEHLLRTADLWEPRRVDVGSVNGRYFAFSSGVGLDASVVEVVDAHPRLKARLGPYYFTYAAVSTFGRRYLRRPPRLLVRVGDRTITGVTAVIQNGEHYTYFKEHPIDVAVGESLTGGTLGGAVLERASVLDMPSILAREFSKRAQLINHRHVTPFGGVEQLSLSTVDGRPLPLQVDGDFVGDVLEASFRVHPQAISVVS